MGCPKNLVATIAVRNFPESLPVIDSLTSPISQIETGPPISPNSVHSGTTPSSESCFFLPDFSPNPSQPALSPSPRPPSRAPWEGWKSAGTHIGPKSWFHEERRTRNAGLMMGQPGGSAGSGLGSKKQIRYEPVGRHATCVKKSMPFNPTTVRQEGDRRRIIHGKLHCQAFPRVAVIVY